MEVSAGAHLQVDELQKVCRAVLDGLGTQWPGFGSQAGTKGMGEGHGVALMKLKGFCEGLA